MRKHLALVTAVLTVIIMITGCAETPETVSVMKKDTEQMIETANSLDDKSATVNKQVNAPEVCRKSYRSKDGILEVNIDADVIVPNAETSRIIRVAAHEITQNEVDKWTDFLFHGEDLYDIACFSEMTRPEMEEYIIELKHALAVVSGEGEQIAYSEVAADGKKSAGDADTPMEVSAADELRELITELQKKAASAPEERKLVKTSNKLEYHDKQDFTWTMFASLNDDGSTIKGFNAQNNHGFGSITYADRGDTVYIGAGDYVRDSELKEWFAGSGEKAYQSAAALSEPEISESEAIKLGDSFVSSLNIDMQLYSSEKMNSCSPVFDVIGNQEGRSVKGWRLIYTRMPGEIPITFTEQQCSAPDYGEWWGYEYLSLFATDAGIIEADLQCPYDELEILCGNCRLMDFETIMEVFQKMMQVRYGKEQDTINDLFDITSIRFGYTRITEEDSDFSGLLVPSWSFFGSRYTVYDCGNGKTEEINVENSGIPFMTVNAVDGTVIDIEKGY